MGTAPSFYAAVLASVFMPLCQVMGLWAHDEGISPYAALPCRDRRPAHHQSGRLIAECSCQHRRLPIFCVLGLSVFNVEKTTATGFSIFAFLALTIPFIFLGFCGAFAQRIVA